MAALTLAQSGTNNGTATPATPGSLTTTVGNLLVLAVAVAGTNPTASTPAGWTAVQNSAGATLTVALFIRPNNPGGATNPSSTLGGTVTGWIAVMYELNATGTNEGLISSAVSTQSTAALANIFPTNLGQAQPNELFLYVVGSLGNNPLSGAVSGLNNFAPPGYANAGSGWSGSIQSQTNVRGLTLDNFWGSAAAAFPCPYPSGAGNITNAVASVQIGAWLNSAATIPSGLIQADIGGLSGNYVPSFNQGMIGG